MKSVYDDNILTEEKPCGRNAFSQFAQSFHSDQKCEMLRFLKAGLQFAISYVPVGLV